MKTKKINIYDTKNYYYLIDCRIIFNKFIGDTNIDVVFYDLNYFLKNNLCKHETFFLFFLRRIRLLLRKGATVTLAAFRISEGERTKKKASSDQWSQQSSTSRSRPPR